MITIAAFTQRFNKPSARFRIRQHIQPLASHGIIVTDYPTRQILSDKFFRLVRNSKLGPAIKVALRSRDVLKSHAYDGTWVNRELVIGVHSLERFLKRPIVLDVDDAIWFHRPYVKNLAGEVDVVIAGNSFVADWFSAYCKNVYVVSTAIDTVRFAPTQNSDKGERFTIVWTGSTKNLRYLYDIEEPLAHFIKTHPDVFLRVIAGNPPDFKSIPPDRIEFVQWLPNNEVQSLQDCQIGIMPLRDGEWERGKCSFKMLQYMAVGLPVCVSPIGLNADILRKGGDIGFLAITADEWYQALEAIYLDPGLGKRQGLKGRELVESEFSVNVVSETLSQIFKRWIPKL